MKKITNVTEMITLMGALGIIAEASASVKHGAEAMQAWEDFQNRGLEQLILKSADNFTNEMSLAEAKAIIEKALTAE